MTAPAKDEDTDDCVHPRGRNGDVVIPVRAESGEGGLGELLLLKGGAVVGRRRLEN
jgi:hypothetical protein